jgi:predicted ATPase
LSQSNNELTVRGFRVDSTVINRCAQTKPHTSSHRRPAAADLARGFADGAWLVELTEVRDGALVADAVLAALDLRDQAALTPMQALVSQLEDKHVLLVVDNCEHLIDAAATLVAGVLRAAPKLRVIATSREPLEVPGE